MLIKCREILHEASGDDETAEQNPDTGESLMVGISENDYLVCPECQKGNWFDFEIMQHFLKKLSFNSSESQAAYNVFSKKYNNNDWRE